MKNNTQMIVIHINMKSMFFFIFFFLIVSLRQCYMHFDETVICFENYYLQNARDMDTKYL